METNRPDRSRLADAARALREHSFAFRRSVEDAVAVLEAHLKEQTPTEIHTSHAQSASGRLRQPSEQERTILLLIDAHQNKRSEFIHMLETSGHDPLLRWYACDCVERHIRALRKPLLSDELYAELEAAIEQVRWFLVGRVTEEAWEGLCMRIDARIVALKKLEASEEGGSWPTRTIRKAAETVSFSLQAYSEDRLQRSLIYSTTGRGTIAFVAATEHGTLARRPGSLFGPRELVDLRAQNDELVWQSLRLAFLCEAWSSDAEQVAWRLLEGSYPVPEGAKFDD